MREYFDIDYWAGFFTGTTARRRLTENFFSLSLLQVLNYLLPIITLPYLVRVLGPEKYGLISFAQAFIGYFQILTDYGFNLSATREISIHRDNKQKVNEIFSSVMTVKILLYFISFLILSLFLIFVSKFRAEKLIYLFASGIVLGNVLFPVWFFQGMERMKYITILNIIAKGIFTICIFIIVKKTEDYLYVPLLNSMGFLVTGVFSLILIKKVFNIKLVRPSILSVVEQLKAGWHIFISSLAVSAYTYSNSFILGLFTNNIFVGYYSAAEKIIRAVQGLLTPVSQTIFPYISKLVGESKEKAILFIKTVLKYYGTISFIISVSLFFLSKTLVKIILGAQYYESIIVLKILSILPFIISLSNVFGIQTMLNFKMEKDYARILILAGILNIVLAIILVPLLKHIGISIAVSITEIFVTVTMYIVLRLNKIKLFKL